MSWSQVKQQARFAAEQRLHDQVTAWRTAREPTLKAEHQGELAREFRERQAALDALAEGDGAPRRAQGITLNQLEQAFGGLERKYKLADGTFVDADEWDREHGKGKTDGGGEQARADPVGDD